MLIRRRPLLDELLLDGELVVLADGSVQVLSEVASTALNALSTTVWTGVEDLTDALKAAVGLPEEGRSAVFALVSALQLAGLVEVEG